MSWDDVQTGVDSITETEWNSMVSDIKLHWNITGMADVNSWNSSYYHNSGLTWDNSLQKWKALKSGGGTGTANSGDFKASTARWNWISSQLISGGSIITRDISIYGDTISGLANPIWVSSASNKHYVDTISGNLNTKIGAGVLQGSLVNNIGSDYTYGVSGIKFASSQSISGQWRLPIFRTNKPAATAIWDGRMIMSSGSIGNKARIWVCCKNDDGSTYDWVQLGVGN